MTHTSALLTGFAYVMVKPAGDSSAWRMLYRAMALVPLDPAAVRVPHRRAKDKYVLGFMRPQHRRLDLRMERSSVSPSNRLVSIQTEVREPNEHTDDNQRIAA